MQSKTKKIISVVSFLFVLTACQAEGDKAMRDQEKNHVIHPTKQYGRGAKSDGHDTNSEEAATRILTNNTNSIVIYFSRSGNTENMAHMIKDETKSDILELEVTNPYPANYEKTVERANNERETENFPTLSTAVPDFSQYKSVYIGYPIWAMTLANPMRSFLEEYGKELSGKEIFAFSTNAGYGEGESVERINLLIPSSTVKNSLSLEDSTVVENEEQIRKWADQ